MDAKKIQSMKRLYGFGVWAGGVGFILAIFAIIYDLSAGNGLGLMSFVNIGFTLFAYIFFRQELKKLRNQQEK